MTQLVGRHGELERALAHLSSHGRVVVVGPGGIGKTSLALALADRLAAERAVVDADVIGGLSAIESLAVNIVGGPRFGDDPADVLAVRTQRRRLALVVDGADGVVDEVLRMVDDVAVGGDGPWLIVTSRVHPGTWTWPVIRLEPLPITATDGPSPAAVCSGAATTLPAGTTTCSTPRQTEWHGSSPTPAACRWPLRSPPLAPPCQDSRRR